MQVELVDEIPSGFDWIYPEPAFMQRTSHATARASPSGSACFTTPFPSRRPRARRSRCGM